MSTLKNKLKLYLGMFKVTRRDKSSMKLIKWNVAFLLLCLTLYIVMTFYEWILTGHPQLAEFRQFIVVVGGLTVSIQALSRWLVDTDRDGQPDEVMKDRRGNPYGT